jgi:uncharacterized protein (TIGR02246 family)
MKTCVTSIVLSTGLGLLLAGCSRAPADTRESDAKALRDNEARWTQEYAARDVDKVVAHYSDDAVLMSPGMPASHGKEGSRKVLAQMVADPALSLQFQPSQVIVAKSGDLAYTQGSYTMAMTDPNSKQVIHDHGSYVTTYSKQPDGSWKAVADIATSEVSPAAPPPAKAKPVSRTRAKRR